MHRRSTDVLALLLPSSNTFLICSCFSFSQLHAVRVCFFVFTFPPFTPCPSWSESATTISTSQARSLIRLGSTTPTTLLASVGLLIPRAFACRQTRCAGWGRRATAKLTRRSRRFITGGVVCLRLPVATPQPHFYSYSQGPVYVVVISTETNFTIGSKQWRWFDTLLSSVDRSETPFVIVSGHRPLYVMPFPPCIIVTFCSGTPPV